MRTAADWRWLLLGEVDEAEAPVDRLNAALTLVAESVPYAVASSITELDGGTYRTAATSSPLALTLDLAQYASNEGPCMTAARDRQHQHLPDTASAGRYDGFVAAAREHGVRSSLSVPIRTGYHPAALNIYSRTVNALDGRGRTVAEFFGRALSFRLHGPASAPRLTEAESARVAERRALMRAAEGVVAGEDATTAEAFSVLVERSRRNQRSIYDLARELTATDVV